MYNNNTMQIHVAIGKYIYSNKHVYMYVFTCVHDYSKPCALATCEIARNFKLLICPIIKLFNISDGG